MASIIIPANALATNGYFLIGFGSKSRAMGGTGVAYNMDGMAAAYNPATMIDSVNEFTVGAELFIPPRAIKHDSSFLGDTNERSTTDLFLIPSMGVTWKLNDKITVGGAFIGAGSQTEYEQNTKKVFNILETEAANEAGVELIQMQMIPSIAYKINDTHSIGFSLVLAGQFFRAEGLEDFETAGFTAGGAGAGGLTGEGFSHSFGSGYRLGWTGKFLADDRLTLGVNYSSRVWMDPFSRYTNLFAESGDFDIPENFAFGLAFKATKDLALTFDFQRINYSKVRSIGNPGPDASNPSEFFSLCPGADKSDCVLGGRLGLGFGWTDQLVYKVGADWKLNEKWNVRAGWNYGKSPILKEEVLFNFLAPATPEHHLTMGGSYIFNPEWIVDFSFVYAFLNTITGPTAFGPTGAVVEGSNASIAMEQYSFGAALKIRF